MTPLSRGCSTGELPLPNRLEQLTASGLALLAGIATAPCEERQAVAQGMASARTAHADGLTPGHHYRVFRDTWNAAGKGKPQIAGTVIPH